MVGMLWPLLGLGLGGCWWDPGLTTKAGGACVGILVLGTDPWKWSVELTTATKTIDTSVSISAKRKNKQTEQTSPSRRLPGGREGSPQDAGGF